MYSRQGTGSLTHKSGTIRYTLHQKANETLERLLVCFFCLSIEMVYKQLLFVPKTLTQTNGLLFIVFTSTGTDFVAIDFYNDANMLFSIVQDDCTTFSCPIMSAGERWVLVLLCNVVMNTDGQTNTSIGNQQDFQQECTLTI